MECKFHLTPQSHSVLNSHSSALKYDITDFGVVAAILKLSTNFQVKHLRLDILRGLSSFWPKTLAQWEIREAKVTSISGIYEPRKTLPHPMYVNLYPRRCLP